MDLLYNTGKYIQYLLITYNEKESVKIYIDTYEKLNHFAVHLKLIHYCKSTTLQ